MIGDCGGFYGGVVQAVLRSREFDLGELDTNKIYKSTTEVSSYPDDVSSLTTVTLKNGNIEVANLKETGTAGYIYLDGISGSTTKLTADAHNTYFGTINLGTATADNGYDDESFEATIDFGTDKSMAVTESVKITSSLGTANMNTSGEFTIGGLKYKYDKDTTNGDKVTWTYTNTNKTIGNGYTDGAIAGTSADFNAAFSSETPTRDVEHEFAERFTNDFEERLFAEYDATELFTTNNYTTDDLSEITAANYEVTTDLTADDDEYNKLKKQNVTLTTNKK